MKFSIIKREPSYFFENIHEDLNRFLKDTFGDISRPDNTSTLVFQAFRPAIEVKEKKNEYNLKIELPNVNKEDIDVELGENSISVNAESKFEQCSENENIKTSEFRYGKFTRTIPFENSINMDTAKCEFKNGILNIHLDKLQQDKEENTKKLKIN